MRLSSDDFFLILTFSKVLPGTLLECEIVKNQIRTDVF